MRNDYTKAINRRFILDTSNRATSSEDAQLQLAPLHIEELVMDPAARTKVVTLRGIAAYAKAKYYPKRVYYYSTLGVTGHVDSE